MPKREQPVTEPNKAVLEHETKQRTQAMMEEQSKETTVNMTAGVPEDKLKEAEFYYKLSIEKKEYASNSGEPTYYLKGQDLLVDLSQQYSLDYRVWWELCKPMDFAVVMAGEKSNNPATINNSYFDKALDLAPLEKKKDLIKQHDTYSDAKDVMLKEVEAREAEERTRIEEQERKEREAEEERQKIEQQRQQEAAEMEELVKLENSRIDKLKSVLSSTTDQKRRREIFYAFKEELITLEAQVRYQKLKEKVDMKESNSAKACKIYGISVLVAFVIFFAMTIFLNSVSSGGIAREITTLFGMHGTLGFGVLVVWSIVESEKSKSKDHYLNIRDI